MEILEWYLILSSLPTHLTFWLRCNFRGKATGNCLDAIGHDGSVAYGDCKTPHDWENLIGALGVAIEDVENSNDGDFEGWSKAEAYEHLKMAKFWLEFWYEFVKNGEPIELFAWC